MSYLLDKKIKRKKFFYLVFFVIFLLILFYFRLGILNGLSYASHKLFRPVLILGNKLGEKVKNAGSYFVSKNSLYLQNQSLQSQLDEDEARMSNYNSVLAENVSLKEILGRNLGAKLPSGSLAPKLLLAAILSKPNQSLYDTLVIDAGAKQELQIGNTVFGFGAPIGRISDIYLNSSKVILFSNSGEKTQVVISDKNIFLEIVGRGGGNFEMILPRDFTLVKGDQAVLPGIIPYVLAIVRTTISDPRDSFVKALLVSPVNIQELKFVEVEAQK